MGEGIVDSRLTRHQFWVTVEFFESESSDNEGATKRYNVPSLLAQHLTNSLNYPANIYFIEKYDETQQLNVQKSVQLLNYNLPCDLHVVNLRTLTEHNLPLFPSKSALLILQRFGYDCRLSSGSDDDEDDSYAKSCARNGGKFGSLKLFRDVQVEQIHRTSLTALKSYGQIKSFSSDPIESMELRTFNMTFT
jgi:alpha-mannosidase